MFDTALVALDLSPAEGAMLACLVDLRDMGVKHIILTHVVRVGYIQGAEYGKEEDIAKWLDGRAQPLRDAGLEVEIDIRDSGVPAEAILQAAADHRADLIVIGSRGQNMVRGLFLGSTVRDVIRRTSLPVYLEWIKATEEGAAELCERVCHGGLKRMMLATDFSSHTVSAEATAMALASRADTVDLVHVQTAEESARYTRWTIMVRAALASIGDEIKTAGGKAMLHQPSGKPSEQIARVATEQDVSLIVIGKHGQNWVQSMIIGSTAANLCEIARRPVLMVPLKEVG